MTRGSDSLEMNTTDEVVEKVPRFRPPPNALCGEVCAPSQEGLHRPDDGRDMAEVFAQPRDMAK